MGFQFYSTDNFTWADTDALDFFSLSSSTIEYMLAYISNRLKPNVDMSRLQPYINILNSLRPNVTITRKG